MNTFYEMVEEVSNLSLDEKESFVNILQKRISEEKRLRLIEEIKESNKQFEEGNKYTSSIDEIMKEVLT